MCFYSIIQVTVKVSQKDIKDIKDVLHVKEI